MIDDYIGRQIEAQLERDEAELRRLHVEIIREQSRALEARRYSYFFSLRSLSRRIRNFLSSK